MFTCIGHTFDLRWITPGDLTQLDIVQIDCEAPLVWGFLVKTRYGWASRGSANAFADPEKAAYVAIMHGR